MDVLGKIDMAYIGANLVARESFAYRTSGPYGTDPKYWINSSLALPSWSGYLHFGDGGQPIFALINNELVAAGTWDTTTVGAWWGYDLGEVNAAIYRLSSRTGISYEPAQAVDLSGFRSY